MFISAAVIIVMEDGFTAVNDSSVAQLSGQERDKLTRRRGEGGGLKPSALIFVANLWAFLAGTAGNSRRALRGQLPLRVKSPWRELRAALRCHGLGQHQGEL